MLYTVTSSDGVSRQIEANSYLEAEDKFYAGESGEVIPSPDPNVLQESGLTAQAPRGEEPASLGGESENPWGDDLESYARSGIQMASDYAPLLALYGGVIPGVSRLASPMVGRGLSAVYRGFMARTPAPTIAKGIAESYVKPLVQKAIGQEGVPLMQTVAEQFGTAAGVGGATAYQTGSPLEGFKAAATTALSPTATMNKGRILGNAAVNTLVGGAVEGGDIEAGLWNAAVSAPGDVIGTIFKNALRPTYMEKVIMKDTGIKAPIVSSPTFQDPYLEKVAVKLGKELSPAITKNDLTRTADLGKLSETVDELAGYEAAQKMTARSVSAQTMMPDKYEELLKNTSEEYMMPRAFKEGSGVAVPPTGPKLDVTLSKEAQLQNIEGTLNKYKQEYETKHRDIYRDRDVLFPKVKDLPTVSFETVLDPKHPTAMKINQEFISRGREPLISDQPVTLGTLEAVQDIIGREGKFFNDLGNEASKYEVSRVINAADAELEALSNKGGVLGDFLTKDKEARTKSMALKADYGKVLDAMDEELSRFPDKTFAEEAFKKVVAARAERGIKEGTGLNKELDQIYMQKMMSDPTLSLKTADGRNLDEIDPKKFMEKLTTARKNNDITDQTYQNYKAQTERFLSPENTLIREVRVSNSYQPIVDNLLDYKTANVGVSVMEDIAKSNPSVANEILGQTARRIITNPDNIVKGKLDYERMMKQINQVANPEGIGNVRPSYLYDQAIPKQPGARTADPITDLKLLLEAKKDISEVSYGTVKALVDLFGQKEVNLAELVDKLNFTFDPQKAALFRDNLTKMPEGKKLADSIQAFLISKTFLDSAGTATVDPAKAVKFRAKDRTQRPISVDALKAFIDPELHPAVDKVSRFGYLLNKASLEARGDSYYRDLALGRGITRPFDKSGWIVAIASAIGAHPERMGRWLAKDNGIEYLIETTAKSIGRPLKNYGGQENQ